MQPNTAYHYRLAATGTSGSYYGQDQVLTTLALPVLSGSSAGAISAAGATLNGMVTPNGVDTLAWFQYGTTASYGSTTPTVDVGSGWGPVAVGLPASGLQPHTVYHFRLATQSAAGTFYGPDATFTTGGAVIETLHTFSGPDGQEASRGLMQASDGNYYGTMERGGVYGYGTVYRLTASGSLTTLISFNLDNGAFPLLQTPGIQRWVSLWNDPRVGGFLRRVLSAVVWNGFQNH